jgi:ribose/xylose/arabinose/galactoside ABC-type transport system permease subunit
MTTTPTPAAAPSAPRSAPGGARLVGALQTQGAVISAVLVALLVLGALRYGSQFATGFNAQSVLADDAKYALVALGMTLVIMTGGIDLSVGGVALLGGVVAALLSDRGFLPAALAGLAVGTAAGLANGLLVTRLRLQPFIVTLAMLLMARGLAGQLSHDAGVTADGSSGFQGLATWSVFGVPSAALVVVVLYLLVAAVVRWTPFGRQVLAIGGNEDATRLMGLRVDLVKTAVYVISGALAGLAGVFLAAQTGSVATGAGLGWELSAIAAVVVGGTLLTGGVGSVIATGIGVGLLQLIFNLITFENG